MKRFCLFALLLLILSCKATKEDYVGTWKIVKVQINLTGNEADKERMQQGMSRSVEQGAGFEIATDSLFLLDGKELTDVSSPMPLVYDKETGVFTGTPDAASFAPTMLLQPETLRNDTLVTGITMLRGEDLYASGLYTCIKVDAVKKADKTAYENGEANNVVTVEDKKECSHGEKSCTKAEKEACKKDSTQCDKKVADAKKKSCGGHKSCSHSKIQQEIDLNDTTVYTELPKEEKVAEAPAKEEAKADAEKAQ